MENITHSKAESSEPHVPMTQFTVSPSNTPPNYFQQAIFARPNALHCEAQGI